MIFISNLISSGNETFKKTFFPTNLWDEKKDDARQILFPKTSFKFRGKEKRNDEIFGLFQNLEKIS